MAQRKRDSPTKTQSIDSSYSPSIIIVGAGISGIGAANSLIKAGIKDVRIVEATSRVGGRIHSVDLETTAGHKVELGANWVRGNSQNPIFRIAEQNNLLSTKYNGRSLKTQVFCLQESGQPVRRQVIEEVNMKYGFLLLECKSFYHTIDKPAETTEESVGSFVKREFGVDARRRLPEEECQLRRQCLLQRLMSESIKTGADSMDDVSLGEFGCFEYQHGFPFAVPYGFEKIVDLLRADVPSEKILLNHPVSRIQWDNRDPDGYAVTVECANGKRLYGDVCLVTTSLGFLQQHAGDLFCPRLPAAKVDAIGRIVMGTVNKIILEFDGQVLPNDVDRLEMIWDPTSEEEGNMERDWVRKIPFFEAISSSVLMGWLSGKEAEYIEKLSEEEVGRRCVEVLENFLHRVTPVLPELKKVTRTRWRSDSYTLGSFCHLPVGGNVDDICQLAEPVKDERDKPVLLFAGDATDTTYFSSTRGALQSGRREAERIINFYKNVNDSI